MIKETLKALVITFGIVSIAFGLAVACATWEQAEAEKVFNNGKCILCETGEYKFSNVSKTQRGNTYYFYECDECGYIIETNAQVSKK